jgi:hypothetical protein
MPAAGVALTKHGSVRVHDADTCRSPRTRSLTVRSRIVFSTMGYARLMEAVRDADLLVTHPSALVAPMVVEQTGVRWVSTILSPLHFVSGYDPVLPSMTRWLPHRPWSLPVRFAHQLAAGVRLVTSRWVEPVQSFRAWLGLGRSVHPMFEGQHAPAGVLALSVCERPVCQRVELDAHGCGAHGVLGCLPSSERGAGSRVATGVRCDRRGPSAATDGRHSDLRGVNDEPVATAVRTTGWSTYHPASAATAWPPSRHGYRQTRAVCYSGASFSAWTFSGTR